MMAYEVKAMGMPIVFPEWPNAVEFMRDHLFPERKPGELHDDPGEVTVKWVDMTPEQVRTLPEFQGY